MKRKCTRSAGGVVVSAASFAADAKAGSTWAWASFLLFILTEALPNATGVVSLATRPCSPSARHL